MLSLPRASEDKMKFDASETSVVYVSAHEAAAAGSRAATGASTSTQDSHRHAGMSQPPCR